MKSTLILLIAVLSLMNTALIGQNKERCLLNEKMQTLFLEHPEYEQQIEQGFKDFNAGKFESGKKRVPVVIPVHVIIVHSPGAAVGTGNNYSLEHVMSQIDVLNQDFGHYNSDSGNTPAQFPSADTDIQFCLASVDPNGNPTDGITRYPSNGDMNNGSTEQTIKQATRWDRDLYLNIWSAELGGGILGYAYTPSPSSLPNATLDGVVVNRDNFGGPGYSGGAPYDLGRTATHEVGHFLGLQHIWRNDGCGQDDGIADTPLQDVEHYGCPNHPSPSCSNNGDMFMNYMDYVNDNCMNAFTPGQGNYMQTIMGTSRSSLAGSSFTACSAAIIPLAVELIDVTNTLCNGSNDGTFQVSASGGSPNYTYTLNTGLTNNTGIFSGLYAGTYTVQVNDTGGQSISIDVVIGEPTAMIIQLSDQQNNLCASDNLGSITVYAIGGTSAFGDYQYSINQGSLQSNGTFSNLPTGSYTVEAYDDNNCIASVDVQITSPPAIQINVQSQINVSCHGGSNGFIDLLASGGNPNFTYHLGNLNQSNGTFTGLSAGPYTVLVTDQNGCSKTSNFIITEPNVLNVTTSNIVNVACNGDSSGSATLAGNGGTPSYLYSLNGINFSNNNNFTGLSAGQYTMYIQDLNQCTAQSTFVLSENPPLLLSLNSQTNVPCFGDQSGSINVSANGGVAPYTYSLNGITNNTGIFTGLTSGPYTVQVTDAAACNTEINVTITESSGLTVSLSSSQNVSCNGASDGSITVSGQGGTGNYTYSIDGVNYQTGNTFTNLPSATYTVIMNDGNNCMTTVNATVSQPAALGSSATITNVACNGIDNGSVQLTVLGGTAPYSAFMNGTEISVQNNNISVNNLAAGDFVINIQDNHNCLFSYPFSISEPEILSGQIASVTEQSCIGGNDGGAVITAIGGTPDYIYTLNGTTNNTGVFTGLNAGIYAASVKDANNCIHNFNVSIPLEGGLSVSSMEVNDISCKGENNGSVVVTMLNGNDGLVYTLNGMQNSTGVFENLEPGSYELTISDPITGCQIVSTVMVSEPAPLTVDANVSPTGTVGVNTTNVSITGGTGPYTIAIGDKTNEVTDTIIKNLPPNSYTIWVKDANGCEDSTMIIISNTENLSDVAKITVSPNPFLDQFNIEFDAIENHTIDITLYDINGRLVYLEKGIKISIGKNNHTIFAKNLVNSIYILKIASNSKLYIQKIFKD